SAAKDLGSCGNEIPRRFAPRNDMAKQKPHRKAVRRWRIAVLLSGRGSNFEAIADAVADGRIGNSEIVAVISDVPDARGLARVRELGLPAFPVDRSRFSSRREHENAMEKVLDAAQPDLICLAGYMRVLSPEFVSRYGRKVLNIHPSLLPKFPGLQAQRR